MSFTDSIVDLFQRGPAPAIVGFLLICAMLIAGPACLAVGVWLEWYCAPLRVMRRRLARRRRR